MDSEKKIEISRLRALDLFTGLDEAQLAEIADSITETTALAGTVLIQQGQVGREIFLLEEGTVRVCRGEPDAAGFYELQAPTFFGARALRDPERIRTANVKALNNLRLLTVQITPFLSFIRRTPPLREKLRQLMAERPL